MTDDEIQAYARYLIKGQAAEVDYLGIFEVYEDYAETADLPAELGEDDAKKVADLIGSAVVTVTFPDAS